MVATILPQGTTVFVDGTGAPLASGKVYTYVPGTTTNKTTWQDAAEQTANTNPIILNSDGACLLYGSGSYRIILEDSNGVTISDSLSTDTSPFATGTSTTSLTIGTGSMTLTTQSGLAFTTGQYIGVSSTVTPTDYMIGVVTAYTASSGSLTFNSQQTSGSGTLASWNIVSTGVVGAGATPGTNSVTNSILAQAPQYTMKGNNTGSTANELDLTVAQIQTLLNLPAIALAGQPIAGFVASSITSSSSTVCSMSFGQGSCVDSTNAGVITSSGNISWNITNGNAINGYSGGTTLPNSTTIHFYACQGTTGTGIYAIPNSSYPLSAASAPSGYSSFVRRVWSAPTNSSGVLLGALGSSAVCVEMEGGAVKALVQTAVADYSASSIGTTAAVTQALSVPAGIKVKPLLRGACGDYAVLVTSLDENDEAPASSNTAPLFDAYYDSASTAFKIPDLTTNTSAQIRIRGTNTAAAVYLITYGWTDMRRN